MRTLSLKYSMLSGMGQENSTFESDHKLQLISLLEPQMQNVNRFILEKLTSSVEIIPQVSNYMFAAGGKRLRPLLALASAEIYNYSGSSHIALAACIECIHTATLLHDDVIDESQLRRGKPTANSLWNNKTSIIVGDFLLSQAFSLMIKIGQDSLELLEILSQAALCLVEGEAKQLLSSYDLSLPQQEYLNIIEQKTAPLFAAAAHAGATLAHAPLADRLSFRDFGKFVGIAFQITDDILDYTSSSYLLGKQPGKDFFEGKITLPLILAYENSSAPEKRYWQQLMAKQIRTEADFQEASQIMHERGIFEKAQQVAEVYSNKAQETIGNIPDQPIKHALLEVAQFSVSRRF